MLTWCMFLDKVRVYQVTTNYLTAENLQPVSILVKEPSIVKCNEADVYSVLCTNVNQTNLPQHLELAVRTSWLLQ